MFVNAQSMKANKSHEIKTVALRSRATFVAVAEIWGLEKRDPLFLGYKRRVSRHMGIGRGIGVWVHAGGVTHMEKVHDDI